MTKAIIVIGNTKHEAEQWITKADMPQPCIAMGKDLQGIKGMRVAQVLVLSTVKDLSSKHIHQLRRELAISIGGALTLETVMRKQRDSIDGMG